MNYKKEKPKDRRIGKRPELKKHLINPRYKNFFWTVVIVVILVIFFIVNNTRSVPEKGPYPPTYNPSGVQKPDTVVSYKINFNTRETNLKKE
jgi:hypothetical protein